MKSYLLPIRINNRKYAYINLQDENPKIYRYEIEASGTCASLFSIPFDGTAKVLSQRTSKEDRKVYINEFKKEEDYYVFRLSATGNFNNVKQEGDIRCETEGIYHTYNFNHDFRDINTVVKVQACLEFKEKDTIYTAYLDFRLYTTDLFYTMSLDFGSEASQLLINHGESVHKVKLVEEGKKHFCNGEFSEIKNDRFLQFETEFLYKSIYFSDVKRAGHSFLINNQTVDAALASMGFILLTTNDKYESYITQTDKYTLMPNIKIALLGQNDLENTDDISLEKERYVNVLVAFILLGYEYIANRRRAVDKEYPIGIRVKILVPNVMKCKDTQRLITSVSNRLKKCMFLEDKVRFEVESQSESEASFLGYVNQEINIKGELQGNRFLVVDAGKGTLDYSLLEKDKEHNRFKTLFQSGFVGSGNAISFAVFDHIIALICGVEEETAREKMIHNLLIGSGKDIAGILQLFNEVERIKCSMCNRTLSHKPADLQIAKLRNEIRNIGDLSKMTCSKLSDILKEMTDLGDGYGIIRSMCLRICQNMMKELLIHQSERPFNRVVLAGRAFKFKMLEEVFKEVLGYYYGEGMAMPVNVPHEAKEMCLRGTLDTYKVINVNCGLTGIPQTVNANEEDGEYWELKKKRRYNIINYKLDEKFVYRGLFIDLSNSGYLFINGEVCGEGMGKTFNFFFDGSGFYERTDSGLKELKSRRYLSAGQYELLAESKFPHYREGERIPIFKLPNF